MDRRSFDRGNAPIEIGSAALDSAIALIDFPIAPCEHAIATLDYVIAPRDCGIALRDFDIATCDFAIALHNFAIALRDFAIAPVDFTVVRLHLDFAAAQRDIEPVFRHFVSRHARFHGRLFLSHERQRSLSGAVALSVSAAIGFVALHQKPCGAHKALPQLKGRYDGIQNKNHGPSAARGSSDDRTTPSPIR